MFSLLGSTTARSDLTSVRAESQPQPRLETLNAAEERWTTIHASLLNEDNEPILSPILSLKVGQRCDLLVSLQRTDAPQSEQISFSLHVIGYDAGYYQLAIDAEMISADNPWTFQTTTYIRSDHKVNFRWSGADGRARSLELVLFDADIDRS